MIRLLNAIKWAVPVDDVGTRDNHRGHGGRLKSQRVQFDNLETLADSEYKQLKSNASTVWPVD